MNPSRKGSYTIQRLGFIFLASSCCNKAHSQGIESAMETMFDILFAGLLILGSILAFAIAYLIQRRPWQRIVVFVLAALLFGTTLVIPDFEGTLLAGLPIAGMLLAFVLGLIGWRIKPNSN